MSKSKEPKVLINKPGCSYTAYNEIDSFWITYENLDDLMVNEFADGSEVPVYVLKPTYLGRYKYIPPTQSKGKVVPVTKKKKGKS